MKKSTWIIIALVAVVAIAFFWGIGKRNTFVGLEENVKTAWSQVESQYQRRADLIPNLVATVKGYAAHEKETLESVIKARSEATSTQINADNMDEAALQKFQDNQNALSSALSKLMVVVERYPELKANENFMNLQHQLEGTENRIAVARQDFNTVAQTYNKEIRLFPGSLVASFCGFTARPYFSAQPGSDVAPTVAF